MSASQAAGDRVFKWDYLQILQKNKAVSCQTGPRRLRLENVCKPELIWEKSGLVEPEGS